MTRIKWIIDCEITTYQSEDDNEVVRVNTGETETVDIVKTETIHILKTKQKYKEKVVDMQFGNGSWAFAVPTSWFEVIK